MFRTKSHNLLCWLPLRLLGERVQCNLNRFSLRWTILDFLINDCPGIQVSYTNTKKRLLSKDQTREEYWKVCPTKNMGSGNSVLACDQIKNEDCGFFDPFPESFSISIALMAWKLQDLIQKKHEDVDMGYQIWGVPYMGIPQSGGFLGGKIPSFEMDLSGFPPSIHRSLGPTNHELHELGFKNGGFPYSHGGKKPNSWMVFVGDNPIVRNGWSLGLTPHDIPWRAGNLFTWLESSSGWWLGHPSEK